MKKFLTTIAAIVLIGLFVGCDMRETTSDEKQRVQQEQIVQNITAQTGMPNIVNGRERKLMKEILEKRDNAKYITYVYLHSEQTGKLVYVGKAIGYPIPYSTQYTSPERLATSSEASMQGNVTLPQADPNGLFSPSSANGTWVDMINPTTGEAEPVYFEPNVVASPFPLDVGK